MYLFKKIVGPLLFPAPLCLWVLAAGLVVLWFTKRQRTGKILVTVGAVLLLLFTNGLFSDLLLRPLEYRYLPLLADGEAGLRPPVKWIVVLGGGHFRDERMPPTSQMSATALARLVEGVRLHRLLPGSKLVTSGGGVGAQATEAYIMAEAAKALGVDPDDIVLEPNSRDTKDQAAFVREVVGDEPFILVTSAYHIPRSVALFRRQGLDPIPAPVGYMVRPYRGFQRSMIYPGAAAMTRSERAFYERLGMLWGKLRGQV